MGVTVIRHEGEPQWVGVIIHPRSVDFHAAVTDCSVDSVPLLVQWVLAIAAAFYGDEVLGPELDEPVVEPGEHDG